MQRIIPLPVLLDSVRTCKDRSLKVTFVTRELLPDQASILLALANQEGFAYFAPNAIQDIQFDISKDNELPTGKTPGQRLRNTLYVLWEQEGKNGDFNAFYANKMEHIISTVKDKLE